jgi:hypothetical protein
MINYASKKQSMPKLVTKPPCEAFFALKASYASFSVFESIKAAFGSAMPLLCPHISAYATTTQVGKKIRSQVRLGSGF